VACRPRENSVFDDSVSLPQTPNPDLAIEQGLPHQRGGRIDLELGLWNPIGGAREGQDFAAKKKKNQHGSMTKSVAHTEN